MSMASSWYRKFKVKDRIRKKVETYRGFVHARIQAIIRDHGHLPENEVIVLTDKIMAEIMSFVDKIL